MSNVQVRSLTLDVKVWDEAVLGMMERIGNDVANEAWEAELVNETARSAFALHTKLEAVGMASQPSVYILYNANAKSSQQLEWGC